MSIMAKTPSGYKKIGSAYLGERPVDKVFNANGDVVYALQRELTGVPPLLFKGKEQSELLNYRIYGNTETKQRDYSGSSPLTVPVYDGELYNYRIYGNTANGESVGEKTANLFDGEWEQGSFNEGLAIGTPFQNTKILIDSPLYNYRVRTANICNIKENSVISFNDTKYSIYIMYYDADSCYTGNHSDWITTSPYIINASNVGIAIKRKSENLITPDNVADINFMLNTGSTPLPYEPYGYKVPITVTNSGTTSNETIYLPEPIKMVGSEAEYVDFYSQTLHRVRKNLLPNTATSQTINGVTFTVNSDGSVTCNGTCVSNTASYLIKPGFKLDDEAIRYTLTGCPKGGARNSTYVLEYSNAVNQARTDSGDGVSFTLYSAVDYPNAWVRIMIFVGYTCDNLTFYPMIRKADIEDDTYEPYIENVDVPITVPALPISTGTNTVTVNTTVQPSSVEVSTNENVSVGDLVTSGQHAGEYKVPVTVEGKNLLQNTATSQTINDVTFTVNDDGSVTCNGTASVSTFFSLKRHLQLEEGQSYYLTGCPTGGAGSSFRLYAQTDLGVNFYLDSGNGAIINYISQLEVLIVIYSGYTCDNLTFYPMIRKADIEDDTYEPYRAPVTTPIYLPEPIKMVGDEAEYVDYAEQKQYRVRKNLLQNTATSQTVNGVTFTMNSDGSLTCNGTARATGYIKLNDNLTIEAGEYIVTANNTELFNHWYIDVTNLSNELLYRIVSDSDAISFNSDINTRLWFNIQNGYTCDNLTFYPMIRKADIEDDTYEPYIENTDIDVTLPALPTIKGTNVLSVDTEVQPSRMDIKGRIKTLI